MLFWSRFGRVLGTVFGAFWTILGGFWGFEKESNFEGEVGTRFEAETSSNMRLGGNRLGPVKGGVPQLGEG